VAGSFRIIAESNGHRWTDDWTDSIESLKGRHICVDCGFLRRADDKNKPCKGKVKVELRDGQAS
jgi:hypothetical protein